MTDVTVKCELVFLFLIRLEKFTKPSLNCLDFHQSRLTVASFQMEEMLEHCYPPQQWVCCSAGGHRGTKVSEISDSVPSQWPKLDHFPKQINNQVYYYVTFV